MEVQRLPRGDSEPEGARGQSFLHAVVGQVHRSWLAALRGLRAHGVSGERLSGITVVSTSPAPGSRRAISAREVSLLSTPEAKSFPLSSKDKVGRQ